jgi:hypothetical protein
MTYFLYGLALLAGIIAAAVYWSNDTDVREWRSKPWITAFIVFLVLGIITEIIQAVV